MTTSEKTVYPPVTSDATATCANEVTPPPAAAAQAAQGSVIISITSPAVRGRPQITIMSQAMEQVYQGPTSDIPEVLRQYVAEAFDLVYHPRNVPVGVTPASTPLSPAAGAADPPSYVDAVTPDSQRVYSRALDSKVTAKQQLRQARRVAKQTIRDVRRMVKEQRRAVHSATRGVQLAKRDAKREARLAKEDAKLEAKRAKLKEKSKDRDFGGSSPTSPAQPLAGDGASSTSTSNTVKAVRAAPEAPDASDSPALLIKVFGQEFRFGKAKSGRPRRDSLSSVSSVSSLSSESSLSSDSDSDGGTDSDYDQSLYVPVGSSSTAATEAQRDEKKPLE